MAERFHASSDGLYTAYKIHTVNIRHKMQRHICEVNIIPPWNLSQ